MNLSYIYLFWGIAGYIAYSIFLLSQPSRQKNGWDFFLHIACFSLIIFVTTNLSIFICHHFLSNTTFFLVCKSMWKNYFEDSFINFPLTLGIIFWAPLVGIFSIIIWKKTHKCIEDIIEFIGGKRPDLEFPDVFFEFCHNLLNKPIVVTLKNDKVYIGILYTISQDPNELRRYMEIIPILSGYRNKNDLGVVYTTSYIDINKDNDKSEKDNIKAKLLDLLIPAEEIITISKFNEEIHNKLISLNITKIKPYSE